MLLMGEVFNGFSALFFLLKFSPHSYLRRENGSLLIQIEKHVLKNWTFFSKAIWEKMGKFHKKFKSRFLTSYRVHFSIVSYHELDRHPCENNSPNRQERTFNHHVTCTKKPSEQWVIKLDIRAFYFLTMSILRAKIKISLSKIWFEKM